MNTCDLCGFTTYDAVYQPIGTKRNSWVHICRNCGLVFSLHDNTPYSREPNPSGDADWGNIRFAKGQRLDAVKDMLLPYIKSAERILDVGSSRGDFVRWVREENPVTQIDAVEPDNRISGDYQHQVYAFHATKLEEVSLERNVFDFVYCCQTLEHADSASAMLKQIYDCLKPGGTLFLEVPNIEVIRHPLNVEEFFIDKHNFHFSRGALYRMMEQVGFYFKECNDDNLNIRILALKSRTPNHYTYSLHKDNHPLIAEYSSNIQRNRAKLPAVVEKINKLLKAQKVAFWGANTLFDLMVRYGGLDLKAAECLVDDYIHGNLDSVHGVPVQSSEALRVYQPDVCIILARFSADKVAEKARCFGIRNVIKFFDLLEAV